MKKYICIFGAILLAGSLCAEEFFPGNCPKITLKHNKKDGDPVNIMLIGTKEELVDAMSHAGWSIADRLTVGHLAREIESIVAKRDYESAPVSALYLLGRKQDITFEKLEDKSPKHRHHVRLWVSSECASGGMPVWFGAATYDKSVGFSRGGELTHHIDPDIDLEREMLVNDLMSAGKLQKLAQMEGLGLTFGKRNGEGDLYFTDGEIALCYLAAASSVSKELVIVQRPAIVRHKLRIWKFIKDSVLRKIF